MRAKRKKMMTSWDFLKSLAVNTAQGDALQTLEDVKTSMREDDNESDGDVIETVAEEVDDT